MKIWQEDNITPPHIKFSLNATETGYTEITSITNFFNYGLEYGLTKEEVLQYSIELVVDWATESQANKDLIISFIHLNEFVASITTEIRNDLAPPYKGFKIFNTTTSKVEWWNGSTWDTTGGGVSSFLIQTLNLGVNGIYGHTSTNYAYVPIQAMIPLLTDFGTYTKIECKYVLDYETEGSATMDAQLYDYTDSIAVTGSEVSFPNQTWGHGSSGWIDITAYEGKALRIGNKRVGGNGNSNVKIEGASLILKIS